MCIIFGGKNVPLAEVKGTKIFVGPLSDGKQLTIYENQVSLQSATPVEGSAMILPVPAGMIQLLDLSDCSSLQGAFGNFTKRDIFHGLKQAFPTVTYIDLTETMSAKLGLLKSVSRTLVVREVGNYFVSIAPCLEDIALIDPSKFQVPRDIQQVLATNYGDGTWSFVVCRFKSAQVRPHPIGYIHERLQDGKMFVPTRHAHGSESDRKSFFSSIASRFSAGGEHHDDWDHELYSWGCEDSMQLTDSVGSVTEAGETPGEKEKRLRQRMRELPGGTGRLYHLKQGIPVSGSVSLLNEILTRSNAAHLTQTSWQFDCELVDALRCREIKPPASLQGDNAFQPKPFGAPASSMPNADLILTVDQHHLRSLPAPITKEERLTAIAAMRLQWTSEKQNEWQVVLSTGMLPHALVRLLCRRRKQVRTSVELPV